MATNFVCTGRSEPEDGGGLGCCGCILMGLSYVLVALFFPFSLCMTIKVWKLTKHAQIYFNHFRIHTNCLLYCYSLKWYCEIRTNQASRGIIMININFMWFDHTRNLPLSYRMFMWNSSEDSIHVDFTFTNLVIKFAPFCIKSSLY